MNQNDLHADDFRIFATCALKLSAAMLDAMSPEARQGLELGIKGGARLELSFGPLPAFERLALVLVEAEGKRHPLGVMRVNSSPDR